MNIAIKEIHQKNLAEMEIIVSGYNKKLIVEYNKYTYLTAQKERQREDMLR